MLNLEAKKIVFTERITNNLNSEATMWKEKLEYWEFSVGLRIEKAKKRKDIIRICNPTHLHKNHLCETVSMDFNNQSWVFGNTNDLIIKLNHIITYSYAEKEFLPP